MTPADPAPPTTTPRRRPLIIAVIAVIAALALAVTTVIVVNARTSAGAAPDTAALAGELADQTLEWEPCVFQEEIPNAAPPAGTDVSNLECATIDVPKDWFEPDAGETWEVRISHAKNIEVDDPDYHTTVLTHPGGPVTPGLSYSALVQSWLPEMRETTNFVSFDQRGLGQSSHAQCEYEYVHDPEDENAATRAIAEACADDPDVATMTTEQAVYDMDFIRHLLGIEKVSYFGASYGTWIGSWFGTVFSDNIERMVFDSTVDFTEPSIQTNYDTAYAARDRQFRLHLMNYIARQDATLGLGDDPGVIWERYFAATSADEASLAATLAWTTTGLTLAFASSLGYDLAAQLVASVIATGESAEAATDVRALTEQYIRGVTALPAERQDAAIAAIEPTMMLYVPAPAEPGETVSGTLDSLIEFTKCSDGEWDQGEEHWQEFNERTAVEAPFSTQLQLVQTPLCAFWPTGATVPTPSSDFPETIVLQSELDTQTPYEAGWGAATRLPNTSLIAIDNENAHGIFPYGTDAVDRPVIEFLLGGERPAEVTVVPAKPIGAESSTFESWSALQDDGTHVEDTPRFTGPLLPAPTAELSVDAPSTPAPSR